MRRAKKGSLRALLLAVALVASFLASSETAQAASDYDSLLHVTPTLYVYTDGAAKTQTMDISGTWWSDFQQTYQERLDQNLGWPANFVTEFSDIMASGGSWGVYTRENSDGILIGLVGTRDPNAHCDFIGSADSGSFQCVSSPGYEVVSEDYFTHNSFGGNGCIGSGVSQCSNDGMNVYAAPTVGTGNEVLNIPNSGLANLKFYKMNFQISYPSGYAGAQISTSPSARYVAMGDSFSSGEGVTPFTSESSSGLDACDRSTQAYSQLLPTAIAGLQRPDFVACSGAVTADLYKNNHSPNLQPKPGGGYTIEPAQMQALSADTKLVTLTIGGNDLGFEAVMTKCVGSLPQGNQHCQDSSEAQAISWRLLALRNGRKGVSNTKGADGTYIYGWQKIIRDIHAKSPNAIIAVAGYPPLVDPNGSGWYVANNGVRPAWVCRVGTAIVSGDKPGEIPNGVGTPIVIYRDEARWISDQVRIVNTAIKGAVRESGIAQAKYVDVQDLWQPSGQSASSRHALCDGDPWIYSISVTVSPDLKIRQSWPGSLHPTVDGQSFGYESAFAATLSSTKF